LACDHKIPAVERRPSIGWSLVRRFMLAELEYAPKIGGRVVFTELHPLHAVTLIASRRRKT
jgi:hypothetical protein